MRLRKKLLVSAGIMALVSMAFAPPAAAASCVGGLTATGTCEDVVTFTTSSSGTRVLTTAVAPTFPNTNLTVSQTITATPATSLVTEALKNGAAWSVKAEMCGVSTVSGSTWAIPTLPDCAVHGMQRASGATTGDDLIAGSIIAVSHVALNPPVNPAGGGGTTTVGSESNLAGQITLLNNTGQLPGTVYTGTYASTTNLSISSFTRTGTWKGYWVVTATL